LILRKYEISNAVRQLPDIEAFTGCEGDVDLAVLALGFEPRASAVSEVLGGTDCRIAQALVYQYPTNASANDQMRPSLEGALRSCGAEISWFPGSIADFLGRIETSLSKHRDEGHVPRVLVDLSSMTGRLAMSLTRALIASDISLVVVYAEAEIYYPTEEDFNLNKELWRSSDTLGLERGVGDVSIAIDFPGSAESDKPEWVLAFAGFGRDRMRRALSYINSAFLIESRDSVGWVIGVPPAEGNEWRYEAVKYIHELDDTDHTIPVSTFDYKDTITALAREWSIRELSHNLTLIPLGSKLQSLGLGIFCYVNPNVRVVSATPSMYRSDQYSAGVRAIWSVDFGETSVVRHHLDLVGTLQWRMPDSEMECS
jgi:hypothetical protein